MTRRLTTGFQHVATVTNDLDGLLDFYREVFEADAPVILDAPPGAPFKRHALIEMAPGVTLHPFERPDANLDAWGEKILHLGRLDHFAIMAADEEGFYELRRRLMERGASDGEITDFTAMLSVHYQDPDGTHAEVCWVREDVPLSEVREPASFRPRD